MVRQFNERLLKDVIGEIMQKYHFTEGIQKDRIEEAWENIAGKLVAGHTISLVMKKTTLFLELDDPALKNDLMYQRSSLIEKINLYFGEVIVEKLFIK